MLWSDFLQLALEDFLIFGDMVFKCRTQIGLSGDIIPDETLSDGRDEPPWLLLVAEFNINMLSHRLFILCFLRFPVSSAYIFILTDVAHSWRDYCLH